MTSGALCSDHVNYLILRYLQEAGHENAASAFYRDWHRLPAYRDPENYPFAQHVHRGELVNVIQDGLHHDELIARVKKDERKFRFMGVDSRDGAPPALENGTAASRPASRGGKRKGRPPVMRAPDEFPTPAPKRQRRSEGSEGTHLNGDAMEVDAASASADADEEGEAGSPAVASPEPEIVEVPERYDSMDVAVQTEIKTGPKTSTMYWKVERPGASIYHSMWNPDKHPKNGKALLAVGESLCRFYQVPNHAQDARQVFSIDEPSMPPNSVITASAWHPNGNTAVCAVDSLRELPDGQQVPDQKILTHNRDHGTRPEYICSPSIDPPGIILALRFSSDGQYLLVTRTNLKRGMVLVYDTSVEKDTREPIAWQIFEHQVLDVVWSATRSHFVVCGDNGLVESYHLDTSSPTGSENGFTDRTISSQRLTKLPVTLPEPARKWDKLCQDERSGTYALASTTDRRILLGAQSSTEDGKSDFQFTQPADLEGQLTAFAFQPGRGDDETPSILATTFESGSCTLYRHHPGDSLQQTRSFHLSEGPALALAWAPDGRYLAIGGTELVQIWETETLLSDGGGTHTPALITWRADARFTGPKNGEREDDERPLCEPSLSWSADGERLGFARDDQIAIITFRPPLGSVAPPPSSDAVENGVGGHDAVGVNGNGHASPT